MQDSGWLSFSFICGELEIALMGDAMAGGLPIICGNIRGNSDLVDEDRGGYLIDKNNIGKYADAIRKIIGKVFERQTMGKYNQSKVTKFSMSQVNNIMKDIYARAGE